jgi:hypothetical protein
MPNPAKQIVLGAALLVGTTIVANADPLSRTGDKSAASGAAVPSEQLRCRPSYRRILVTA